ncbi:MAG TPA: SAM-dependent chlorinase/fluorinase [Burkholderiales bacterium]|nr:SAM-dependent chlorinase/fluorinase [Burkholderiales bacterium]
MIVLFTDFGADDIYVAQLKAAILQHAPGGATLLDLLHKAPNFNAKASAHLLSALQHQFPPSAVFLAVVDPGVGSSRDPIYLEADGKRFIGPDNGLLSVIAARAVETKIHRITWRPPGMSTSFHGRDLFAPIAAWLAGGILSSEKMEEKSQLSIQFRPDDLAEVIYVDHYGNVLTGIRAQDLPSDTVVEIKKHRLIHSRIFAEAPVGHAFWYKNSLNLLEIAVNQDNAAKCLGIQIGDPIKLTKSK